MNGLECWPWRNKFFQGFVSFRVKVDGGLRFRQETTYKNKVFFLFPQVRVSTVDKQRDVPDVLNGKH